MYHWLMTRSVSTSDPNKAEPLHLHCRAPITDQVICPRLRSSSWGQRRRRHNCHSNYRRNYRSSCERDGEESHICMCVYLFNLTCATAFVFGQYSTEIKYPNSSLLNYKNTLHNHYRHMNRNQTIIRRIISWNRFVKPTDVCGCLHCLIVRQPNAMQFVSNRPLSSITSQLGIETVVRNHCILFLLLCRPRSFSPCLSFLWTQTRPPPPRRGLCESRQICRVHPLSLHNFYCKCIYKKMFCLKMEIKVTEHNVRNDAIRWQISNSIEVVECIFTLTVFDLY